MYLSVSIKIIVLPLYSCFGTEPNNVLSKLLWFKVFLETRTKNFNGQYYFKSLLKLCRILNENFNQTTIFKFYTILLWW